MIPLSPSDPPIETTTLDRGPNAAEINPPTPSAAPETAPPRGDRGPSSPRGMERGESGPSSHPPSGEDGPAIDPEGAARIAAAVPSAPAPAGGATPPAPLAGQAGLDAWRKAGASRG